METTEHNDETWSAPAAGRALLVVAVLIGVCWRLNSGLRPRACGASDEITMLGAGMDSIAVSYHGYAHTHVDALWHFAVDGRSYNGILRSLGAEQGAPALSVLRLIEG